MRISISAFVVLVSTAIFALAFPHPNSLVWDDSVPIPVSLERPDLEKRRGGGGSGGSHGGGSSGGGGGGRSGVGGGGGSSQGGGSSRGGTGGSSSGRGSSSSSSSSSSRGGMTQSGSGVQPKFGHSRSYYAGGSRTPYASGRTSPLGITPFLLPAAAALAIFPGIWLYSVYAYPYNRPYSWYNETSQSNESLPVVCICQEYSECGCDNNHNSTYFDDLFNGTQPKNTSDVRVAEVNGTEGIYINGTLPNGTTRAESTTDSAATIAQASGYWVAAAVVVATVWGL